MDPTLSMSLGDSGNVRPLVKIEPTPEKVLADLAPKFDIPSFRERLARRRWELYRLGLAKQLAEFTGEPTDRFAERIKDLLIETNHRDLATLSVDIYDPQWTFVTSQRLRCGEEGYLYPVRVTYPWPSQGWKLAQYSMSANTKTCTLVFVSE